MVRMNGCLGARSQRAVSLWGFERGARDDEHGWYVRYYLPQEELVLGHWAGDGIIRLP